MTGQDFYIKQNNDAILHEGTALDIHDQCSHLAFASSDYKYLCNTV